MQTLLLSQTSEVRRFEALGDLLLTDIGNRDKARECYGRAVAAATPWSPSTFAS